VDRPQNLLERSGTGGFSVGNGRSRDRVFDENGGKTERQPFEQKGSQVSDHGVRCRENDLGLEIVADVYAGHVPREVTEMRGSIGGPAARRDEKSRARCGEGEQPIPEMGQRRPLWLWAECEHDGVLFLRDAEALAGAASQADWIRQESIERRESTRDDGRASRRTERGRPRRSRNADEIGLGQVVGHRTVLPGRNDAPLDDRQPRLVRHRRFAAAGHEQPNVTRNGSGNRILRRVGPVPRIDREHDLHTAALEGVADGNQRREIPRTANVQVDSGRLHGFCPFTRVQIGSQR
jgi:hypothetical protein